MKRLWITGFLLLLVGPSVHSSEKTLPLWELGFAGGFFSLPQYMGSDERYTLPLGIPYLIYRGEIIKADRDGLRGALFEKDQFSVDLGFSFGLPVSNSNKARQGMSDLFLTGQVGPRLNWEFKALANRSTISTHLPVRFSLDTHGNTLGWVAEPSLKWEKKHLGKAENISARLDIGLLYAQQRYNDYYYGVPARFATPERAEYQPESGLHSYFLLLSSTLQQTQQLNIGFFLRLRTLDSSVVADSPLVRDKVYLSTGIGFTWIFMKSKTGGS